MDERLFLPSRNEEDELIHSLFNRLNRALLRRSASGPKVRDIGFAVDALHHDFTEETTLKEEVG